MRAALLALVVVARTAAATTDVPVAGERLMLRGGRHPHARIVLRDAAITPPADDPSATGASLVVSGGVADGQCAVALPLEGWTAVRGNGPRRGWRTRAAANGIREVAIEPGRIVVRAAGTHWPCAGGGAERVPVAVTVAAGGRRWCAAFGGDVRTNAKKRFDARRAAAPAACPSTRLTVADLNILHGIFCPASTDGCRRPDRAALLWRWIVARGCPDVVTLQEVSRAAVPLLEAEMATACAFPYRELFAPTNGIDDTMVLSRYAATPLERTVLDGGFRYLAHARIDHPVGPVDVFATHLASTEDGATRPCGASCPPECVAAGASTVRECQATQIAGIVAARGAPAGPAIVAGDFNEDPASFVHRQLTDRGWSDVYLDAGNPECDPASGVGCTSGRIDDDLSQMESAATNENERIDFIFLVPPPAGRCRLDPAATRLFADAPNPFGSVCGPAPAPVCWPSDHVGMQLGAECR